MTSGVGLVRLTVNGQPATENLAGACAGFAIPGCTFLLSGGLGAGKSTFARAFVRALIGADEEVPSPTFTLVQQYGPIDRGGVDIEIWHADLYRLGDPDEVLELGLDEAFGTAICLIEWPDRLGSFAPNDAIELIFDFAADKGAGSEVREVIARVPDKWRADFAAACEKAGVEVRGPDE
ncbi:tRNA (adenosine(37)-N6)-threonylcarbamoyltransferase complex ATPase subunit type 1 TsaE [Nisaea nitritireducens]|uniref:tRNA (adenosine(37)-N6)-threonylcarbamoyltransferase complex ATPase subunit type 1 TsaE n=1 Tax=Nisaea nitritireducens TaxID=568392 RepID=UPI0018677AC1|nr:tRNA (adenosine(37)-N6)-threonylcarbamoyltransferase complex ATPase subunit type 1 TsaE [Nisaea nitritireducens]